MNVICLQVNFCLGVQGFLCILLLQLYIIHVCIENATRLILFLIPSIVELIMIYSRYGT